MQIKKASANKVSVSDKKNTVDFLYDNTEITVLVGSEKSNSVQRPGEYEYDGVSVMTQEIPDEAYRGTVNLATVGFPSQISVLTLSKPLGEKSSDIESLIGSINVVVLTNLSKEIITSLKKFNPEVVVLIKHSGISEEDIKHFGKDYTVEEVEKTVKLEDSLFDGEEDAIKTLYVVT